MFNYERLKEVTKIANEALAENTVQGKLIRRAAYDLVPSEFWVSSRTAQNNLETYLDRIRQEKKEQIQDDILREKVEKIVLALREHKWEPA